MVTQEILDEIISTRNFVCNNYRILRKVDPNDHYWEIIDKLDSFKRNGIFLETDMVINWIGKKFQPKKIMEIGTRTGGSLISLLSNYSSFENVEVVSFDLWEEYISTTFFSRVFSNLIFGKNKKWNFNVSTSKKLKFIYGFIQNLSTKKVKRNLKHFGIPTNKITFVSGDSKITVPHYFKQNPSQYFDYILVDGAHDFETAFIDLENVVTHVNKGGIIVFDDICPESYNLIVVWDKFKNLHQKEFEFFEIMHRKGTAWAIRK